MVNRPPRPPSLPSIPPARRPIGRRAAGIALLVATTAVLLGYRWLAGRDTLFAPHFGRGTTLVTNEFATYNPRAAGAHRSSSWIVTSGSLFERDGAGWTGAPDERKPDVNSTSATGSSVFRVVSRASGFGNVSIRMRLRVDRMLGGLRTGQNWDGVHLFARYQSPVSLYVVSVARRDGSVVAKKKVPGNNANGGTYIQLGPTVHFGLPLAVWHDVRLDVRDVDGGVRLTLHLDKQLALDVVDRGADRAAITTPGRVGLRGDNCEFDFDGFKVRAL